MEILSCKFLLQHFLASSVWTKWSSTPSQSGWQTSGRISCRVSWEVLGPCTRSSSCVSWCCLFLLQTHLAGLTFTCSLSCCVARFIPFYPLSPVHGVRDLFWLPIEQYRKDGRIIRGLQRGAASFGTSTASAALELSNRLVQAIQVLSLYRIFSAGYDCE